MLRRRPHLLVRLLSLVALASVLGVAAGSSVASADTTTTTTAPTTTLTVPTTTPTDRGSYMLQGDLEVSGGSATCPGKPKVIWPSIHAAAFFEATVANLMFGHPQIQDPPAGVPLCTASMSYRSSPDQPYSTFTLNYVEKGTTAWVQSPPEKWSVALPQAVEAFAGTAKPLNGAYTADIIKQQIDAAAKAKAAAAKAAAAAKSSSTSSKSSNDLVPILIGGIVVAILLVGAVVWRQRSTAPEQ